MNLLILAIKQRLFLLFDLTTWNVVLSLSWNLADFTINLKNDILKPRIYSHAWPCSCRAKGFITLMPWSGFEHPSVDQQGTFIQDAMHYELPRLLQLLAFYKNATCWMKPLFEFVFQPSDWKSWCQKSDQKSSFPPIKNLPWTSVTTKNKKQTNRKTNRRKKKKSFFFETSGKKSNKEHFLRPKNYSWRS